MNEKCLSKIKKLLALGQSSNEHEAQSAISKAYELMTLHNISIENINTSEYSKLTLHKYIGYSYRNIEHLTLADILDKYFDVKGAVNITFIGKKEKNKRKSVYHLSIGLKIIF